MNDQTYMKLQDKVKRPVLQNINRNNAMFIQMVEQYEKWNSKSNEDYSREMYEEDIIKCLRQYDLDGYSLAKYLEETCYLEADADLVEILDGMYFVKQSLNQELLNQWVVENFLEITPDVIGKKVNANQNRSKYDNYYITTIRPETYEVTVSDNPNKKGGYVVGYENITFVE